MVEREIRPYRPGITPIGASNRPLTYELGAELRRDLEAALDGLELAPIPAIATGDVTRRPQLRFGTVLTGDQFIRSEEHTSELQSLKRISYHASCFQIKKKIYTTRTK